jgi:hypothetical protein
MNAYDCTGASGEWPLDDGAEVICMVTTPRGPTEITVTVNSTADYPYLGCWSGHSYYLDPPAGRVRP